MKKATKKIQSDVDGSPMPDGSMSAAMTQVTRVLAALQGSVGPGVRMMRRVILITWMWLRCGRLEKSLE